MSNAPDRIEIQTAGPLHGSIRPPGSKSITNRALVCAALAEGRSTLRGTLDSDDTRAMIDSLGRLGLQVDFDAPTKVLTIDGCGGQLALNDADLFVGNSGTTIRFLTAMATVGQGTCRLDGIERMRQRPIGDLLSALNQLGAEVKSETSNDCPPVVVRAAGLAGGQATIAGNISSQFLSGLLMAAPYANSDVELIVEGTLISQPYVEMTLAVMKSFGVHVDNDGFQRFHIAANQRYAACDYTIEPDASAASYFWGAAAITGGRITVEGLSRQSLQGDVEFCDCLAQMGCEVEYREDAVTVTGGTLKGITVDMNAISDTVQTLAAVALFAEGPTTITNVGHIRHKETDRIGDLACELRKLGADVQESADGLRITPGNLHGAEIDTYDDHRMAMSLALVGLGVDGVTINDPGCTAKTYPRFFDDLESLRGG